MDGFVTAKSELLGKFAGTVRQRDVDPDERQLAVQRRERLQGAGIFGGGESPGSMAVGGNPRRQATVVDDGFHDWRLAERLRDLEFRAEYERQREIAAVDGIVNAVDALRERQALSAAQLAWTIQKDPAAVRRLLTASGNPELPTVVAIADALHAVLQIVPRTSARLPPAGVAP